MTESATTGDSYTDRFRSAYREHGARVRGVGAGLLIVGLALLILTLPEFRLWPIAIGSLLVTIGVVLISNSIVDEYASPESSTGGPRPDGDRHRPHERVEVIALGLGGVMLVAAVLSLWLADALESSWPAVIGVVLLMFAVSAVAVVADRLAARRPGWVTWGGLAVSLIAPAVTGLAGSSWVVGIGFTALGLMAYQLGLRSLRRARQASSADGSERAGRLDRRLSLGAGAVGVAAVAVLGYGLAFAGDRWGLFTAIGGYLLTVALLTLGVSWPATGLRPLQPLSVGIAGGLLVALGFLFLLTSGLTTTSVWMTAFVSLVLALVGAYQVWRGEGLLVTVIFGFLVVWGLTDRTLDESATDEALDRNRDDVAGYVVALGDSYMAGEGAPRFFAGTDQKGDQRNECRRAPTAYANLLATRAWPDGERRGLLFLACSGAEIEDLGAPLKEPDGTFTTTDEQGRARIEYFAGKDTDGSGAIEEDERAGQYGEAVQLVQLHDQLTRWAEGDRPRIDVVVVSISGNDAGFGDIAKACSLPGSCAEQREALLHGIELVGDDLVDTYVAIKAELDAYSSTAEVPYEVPVAVMPYPMILSPDACSATPLEQSEHDFLVEFITVLNEQVRVSAAEAGVNYIEEAMFAFTPEGAPPQRICDPGGNGMNVFKLQATDGNLIDRISPTGWVHNSMHPTPVGHALTAAVLVPWVDEHRAGAEAANPPSAGELELEVLGIRSVERTLVNVDSLSLPPAVRDDLTESEIEALSFATRTIVLDDPEADPPYDVPVRLAAPDAAPWYLEGGRWRQLDTCEEITCAETSYVVEGGGVKVLAHTPDGTETTWLLFRERVPEAAADAGVSGEWRLRALQFCSAAERCEPNLGRWIDDQVRSAVEVALPRAMLLIVGGWMFALWFRPDRRLWSIRVEEESTTWTQR